jgi:arylsulfatase A-like enzyme
MNRRQFLGSPTAAALAQTSRRDFRNVLLLIADDHSPIAGCYGNPVIATPNMDRLAREGVRFQNAFCTTPSCSASRSVVLTGLQNHTNGQFGHAHQPHNFHTHLEVQSIPRVAKANGVATGVIGKLHVLPPEVYVGLRIARRIEWTTDAGRVRHGAGGRALLQERRRPAVLSARRLR